MKLKNKKGDNRISDFLRYKQGKMSGWERNAFEKEMQKDPFAAEAEEGFSELAAENIVSDLEFLEKKLKRRVSRRSRAVFYSIAASVTVLMILSSVFVVIDKKHSSKEDTAGFKEKAMEITVSKAVRKPETHAAEPSKPVETVRTDAGSIRPQEEKKAEITEDKGNEPNKPGAGPGKGPPPPTERAASLTSVQQKEAKSEETNKPVASPVTLKAARRYGKDAYYPPEPDGGKIKFDNYIREHIKIPEKRAAGDSVAVNASLRISYRGIIDSIKILDSPAKAYSDEVLRLLKNGPSWKPAVLNGKKIDDSVRLRIMFK